MTAPEVLFSAEQIQQRVRAMARLIAASPLVPDVAMPVLVGGFVFAADLLRALAWEGVAMDVEMIWLRSYGDKRVASAVSMIAGPSEQIAGRHVLVIDGVLDAGRTVAKAVSLIQAAGAASVQVAVILDKQRGDAVAKADYAGFTIGNEFVIGYGMDIKGSIAVAIYWQGVRERRCARSGSSDPRVRAPRAIKNRPGFLANHFAPLQEIKEIKTPSAAGPDNRVPAAAGSSGRRGGAIPAKSPVHGPDRWRRES